MRAASSGSSPGPRPIDVSAAAPRQIGADRHATVDSDLRVEAVTARQSGEVGHCVVAQQGPPVDPHLEAPTESAAHRVGDDLDVKDQLSFTTLAAAGTGETSGLNPIAAVHSSE